MTPYREVEHTADWALHVWAPSLEELFVDAAEGMYALTGAGREPESAAGETVSRPVEVSGADEEALLVAWLQELLYYTEMEGWVFEGFEIEALAPGQLRARVRGRPGARADKVIKAVTYHNLEIRRTGEGFEATIVFDV